MKKTIKITKFIKFYLTQFGQLTVMRYLETRQLTLQKLGKVHLLIFMFVMV